MKPKARILAMQHKNEIDLMKRRLDTATDAKIMLLMQVIELKDENERLRKLLKDAEIDY